MTNDAEWDEAITVNYSMEEQLEFWRGISETRLQYLKEAAKVIDGLINRNYAVICNDDALAKAKEFIDAWGDDE